MDAATIEEANRLRVSMGMKPLPVPGAARPRETSPEDEEDKSATYEGRQSQAYDNYQRLVQAEEAKKKREAKAAAAKKEREKAQRNAVLAGSGLGDADADVDIDAKAWLKGQKKRQKKIEKVRKSAQDKEAAEAAAAAAREYGSKDLVGVKVGHEMSTLLEGDEQVLTLKDAGVLESDDEGDELENVGLRDREKLQERLDLKKKKPVYDPNDIDETGERSVLAQYDEEIHGKKRKHFKLDSDGNTTKPVEVASAPGEKRDLQSLSLDVLNEPPASDYVDISEIKVKKPKKKKSKATRQRTGDDGDALFPGDTIIGDGGAMEDVTYSKKKRTVDDTFVDDDDLQATLARQRMSTLKKRKRVGPEALARQLKEEDEGAEPSNRGGLVIDEVSSFVDAMQKNEEEPRAKGRKQTESGAGAKAVAATEDSDSDADVPMANAAGWDAAAEAERGPADAEAPIEEEQLIGQGMGATMAILRQRGFVEQGSGADVEVGRQHAEFIHEKQRRLQKIEEDARKQRERDRPMLARLSAKDQQEYARKQNANREFQTSKVLQDMFNQGYRPNFNITYTDDHGRSLDAKEAWKHLSHQFHGKSSGNAKTSKLLKKIDQEKKDAARSLFDSSQSASVSSAQQLKKRHEPGVRLS